MSIRKLFLTSNFHFMLVCSTIICLALALLFTVVDWSMSAMMLRQINVTISNEMKEVLNGGSVNDLDHLTKRVAQMSSRSPEFFYLIQNQDGRRLAGNLPAMGAIPGIHDWQSKHLTPRGKLLSVHGLGVSTTDNSYLFVGLPIPKTLDTNTTVKYAFIWMIAGTFVALLTGGLYTSNRLLARVESISRTSQKIISGDLGSRVPIEGKQDEFDELASSINGMLDRIQSLMAEVQHVSSDIAHDLRTPLTSLRQRLELASMKALTTEALRDVLNQSISELDRILGIFSSLLRIAQIEAGSRRATFKRLDLSAIVAQTVDLFSPAIADKGQTLGMDIKPGVATVGDRELLGQLFVNLIDNATTYSPKHATIMIRVYEENERIFAEVEDGGPGIPDFFKGKVLKPFFRLDQSRATSGHGLGLSLVAAIASIHYASLELLDNAPGLKVRLTFNPISTP